MNCKVTWNAAEGPQTASGPGRFRYVNSNQQPTGICFWVIQRGNSSINMATFGFSGSAVSVTPNKLYLGGKMTKITPNGSISYANFDFQDWLKIS